MPLKYFKYLYGVKTSYNRVLGRNLAKRIRCLDVVGTMNKMSFVKALKCRYDAKTRSAKSMSFSKRSNFGFVDAVSCYGEIIGVFDELSW